MNEKNHLGTAVGTEANLDSAQSTKTLRPRQEMLPPVNQLISDELELFLCQDQASFYVSDVEFQLLNRINNRLIGENANYNLGGKRAYSLLQALPAFVISQCILARDLCNMGILGETRDSGALVTYCNDGPNEGLYVPAEVQIRSLAREYNRQISGKDMRAVVETIRDSVPLLVPNRNENLVALGNGLFDLETKEFRSFSPDVVLASKASVAFRTDATTCPVIDGWSVDEWIRELANNDPEVEKLFWQIIAALFRPDHPFNKAVLLYSPTGSNGKGTFVELLRNLVGAERVATLSMSDFGEQFLPETLRSAFCVLSDENEVRDYMKRAGAFKAWVSHDWIRLNVKYGQMRDIKGRGLCVFCINELPSSKDKSESLYRRFVPIPFLKRYVGADENTAIKNDYVTRPEVLEYVANKALMWPLFKSFDIPAVCDELLGQIRVENDPVLQFAEKFLPQFKWDLLPREFLYAVYRAWMIKNVPSGRAVNSNEFHKLLEAYVDDHPSCGWFVPRGADGKPQKVRSSGRIIGEEPLAVEYNIDNWFDIQPVNGSIRKVGTPHNIKASYRGLQRVVSTNSVAPTDDEEPDHESQTQESETEELSSEWTI